MNKSKVFKDGDPHQQGPVASPGHDTANPFHTGVGQPKDLTGAKQGFDQKVGERVRTPNTTGGRYK